MYLWMPPSIRHLSHFTLLFRLYPFARQGGYSCCLRLLHNDVVLRRNPAQTATIFFFNLFFLTFSRVPFAALCGRRAPGWASGAAVGLLLGSKRESKKSQINSIPTQAENPACLPRCGEPSDTPDLAATSTPLPLQPLPDNSSTWLPATRRHKSKLD
ncbi:hypothetical protein V8C44DRAFT_341371 [Trichoderma aethiopicum]